MKWSRPFAMGPGGSTGGFVGLLSTAGGLLFGNDGGGNFVAYDAATGKPLWHAGLGTSAAPGAGSGGRRGRFQTPSSPNVFLENFSASSAPSAFQIVSASSFRTPIRATDRRRTCSTESNTSSWARRFAVRVRCSSKSRCPRPPAPRTCGRGVDRRADVTGYVSANPPHYR